MLAVVPFFYFVISGKKEFLCFVSVICLSSPLHIGYSLEEQQNWHKISSDFEKCGYGVYQTPIHIEHDRIERIVMPNLEFIGYRDFLRPPLTVLNNGHTVKLGLGDYSENSIYLAPRISGGLLSSTYVLESLHFHWGQDNDRGSEHMLNSIRYPMEMHLVHRNVKYNFTAEALNHKDGIAVLGFFFHLQLSDNRRFKHIFRKLEQIRETTSSAILDRTFSLATILPSQLDEFFTYEGSLTTPPCSEAVTWFIFPETIPISYKQMEKFRLLNIENNYRALQPIGQRKVYLRRNDRFINPEFDKYFDGKNISDRSFWLY